MWLGNYEKWVDETSEWNTIKNVENKCKDNPDMCFAYYELKENATLDEINKAHKTWWKNSQPDKCVKVLKDKKFCEDNFILGENIYIYNEMAKKKNGNSQTIGKNLFDEKGNEVTQEEMDEIMKREMRYNDMSVEIDKNFSRNEAKKEFVVNDEKDTGYANKQCSGKLNSNDYKKCIVTVMCQFTTCYKYFGYKNAKEATCDNLKEEYEKWKSGEHFKLCMIYSNGDKKNAILHPSMEILFIKNYTRKKGVPINTHQKIQKIQYG